ncbi:hypothetical protein [Tomitella biformata]|uniref:hypothetical protein n=1 Tax=Tomitella biformata TaxID=630403 RepID=UPI0004633063|nr:hypothetical protein [Tomitella biformata]
MTWTSNDVSDENTETLVWEQERKTLAELLLARGESIAAALVAVAEYRRNQVDNWDGGQYEVDLALPADMFDAAADVRGELAEAARAVIGEGHFQGLTISVRRSDLIPSWDKDLLDSLRAAPPAHKPLELTADQSGA